MITFTITDLSPKKSKTEHFWKNELSIQSRSGLHPAESALIENLPLFKQGSSLLITGNRTGAVAMAASVLFPKAQITCHTLDVHHAAAIVRNLRGNKLDAEFATDEYVYCAGAEDGAPPVTAESNSVIVACTSALTTDTYDIALFMITPSTVSGELILDQLEQIHISLRMGGRCLIAYDGEEGSFTKQLKSVFGKFKVVQQSRKGATFLCTKISELKKARNFMATFQASLPGTDLIELLSLPGVFSHRRPDKGGLALAETAATLLKPGMKVMDFGCGCGMVGALLAQREPQIQLTFIDSSIRAMDATNRNLQALGIEGSKLTLSDTGTDDSDFDIFAGNPPYFSDYRIAELFIEQAHKSLKAGGTALIVTKQTNKIGDLVFERFGNAEVTPRRGYSVIIATK